MRLARQSEAQASWLARDIRTLVHWLSHDVLALAGPDLATRRELFDFIAVELAAREPEDARRIRSVRVALQNQRDAGCRTGRCTRPRRLRRWRIRCRGCGRATGSVQCANQ